MPCAAMTPQSIYRLLRTEGRTESSITVSRRSLRSLGGEKAGISRLFCTLKTTSGFTFLLPAL